MMLLSVIANSGWTLESADVTSAFLQSMEDLEKENLFVRAPAELGAAFGGDGSDDNVILKIRRAFYGLCHAPRKWFETVTNVLNQHGWRPLLSDRCVFVLHDSAGKLCGIAGVHVDDFIIAGQGETYLTARRKLEEAFVWGKWEKENFEFAGCDLRQSEDGTITLSQESYSRKWLEEIPMDKKRSLQTKSALTPTEVTELPGVLGALAWRANQTSPQLMAEIGLLLSEVPIATVDTLNRAKQAGQRSEEDQRPGPRVPRSRPRLEGLHGRGLGGRCPEQPAPERKHSGDEHRHLEVCEGAPRKPGIQWVRSTGHHDGRGHRVLGAQCLDGNPRSGAKKGCQDQQVREHTRGILVMDSRGIYDAMSRNTSSFHSLRNSISRRLRADGCRHPSSQGGDQASLGGRLGDDRRFHD